MTSRSFSFFVTPTSLSAPPCFLTVVKALTSSPRPALSMYATPLRFNSTCLSPVWSRLRTLSPSFSDPSAPSVIGPSMSSTHTFCTVRCEMFMSVLGKMMSRNYMAIAWRHHSPKPVREVLATGSQGLRAMRNALLGAVLIAGCASVAGSRAAEADIFEGDSAAVLTLTAPFHDLFTQAKADADYHVKGQLRWSNEGSSPVTLDGVVISERGHTSRQTTECEFPKLKVDLSD